MTVDLTNAKRAEILTEALPYIRKYNGKIIVIKYGGNAMLLSRVSPGRSYSEYHKIPARSREISRVFIKS